MQSMRRRHDCSKHGSARPTELTLADTSRVERSARLASLLLGHLPDEEEEEAAHRVSPAFATLFPAQQRVRMRRWSCWRKPAGPEAAASPVPVPVPVPVVPVGWRRPLFMSADGDDASLAPDGAEQNGRGMETLDLVLNLLLLSCVFGLRSATAAIEGGR